ncbi:MAG: aminotransferase class V-fold PLP-dependent enzyme [Thermodesulfobacteriota bacterium]
MKPIYFDHAAATPVRPEVLEAMLPYFMERFGNPSAVYDLGSDIKDIIEAHRVNLANLVGAPPEGIVFTSCGAEANNLAIKGAALAHLKKGRHLIVSAVEHHSVLNSARYLEKFHDFEVTFLPVNRSGQVEPERLLVSIPPNFGAQYVIDSDMGDPMGYMDTDHFTLKAKNYDAIYVIGDAANVPTSKAGAVAHYEAEVVGGQPDTGNRRQTTPAGL